MDNRIAGALTEAQDTATALEEAQIRTERVAAHQRECRRRHEDALRKLIGVTEEVTRTGCLERQAELVDSPEFREQIWREECAKRDADSAAKSPEPQLVAGVIHAQEFPEQWSMSDYHGGTIATDYSADMPRLLQVVTYQGVRHLSPGQARELAAHLLRFAAYAEKGDA